MLGVGAELVGVYLAEEMGFDDGGVAGCCHCGGFHCGIVGWGFEDAEHDSDK